MRRRTRLLLLLALGVGGAGLALAGALPQGFVAVAEVAAEPGRFEGREVHLKAIVAKGSLERGDGRLARFAVTDLQATLPVEYHGALPELFEEGRTVVVSGILQPREGGAVLVAHAIQGGCASRYEPAPEGGSAQAGAEGSA